MLKPRWRNTHRKAQGAAVSLVDQGNSVRYVLLSATSVGGFRKAELCHQLKVQQLSRSLQLSSQMGQDWWVGEQGRESSMFDTSVQDLMESTVPQKVKLF